MGILIVTFFSDLTIIILTHKNVCHIRGNSWLILGGKSYFSKIIWIFRKKHQKKIKILLRNILDIYTIFTFTFKILLLKICLYFIEKSINFEKKKKYIFISPTFKLQVSTPVLAVKATQPDQCNQTGRNWLVSFLGKQLMSSIP